MLDTPHSMFISLSTILGRLTGGCRQEWQARLAQVEPLGGCVKYHSAPATPTTHSTPHAPCLGYVKLLVPAPQARFLSHRVFAEGFRDRASHVYGLRRTGFGVLGSPRFDSTCSALGLRAASAAQCHRGLLAVANRLGDHGDGLCRITWAIGDRDAN